MMTSHGIAVGNAIAFAQNNLRSEIEDLLTGERGSSLVGFFVGGTKSDDLVAYADESGNAQLSKQNARPEPPASFVFLEDAATLMDTVAKTKGILTIIDLKALAQHVVDVLEKRDPGNA
ncbi:hypothetical protein EKPJFOCH_3920 [Methylobacterium thuringiense]|uniref:Uncharacterized protein n=2 Tax=Methylobacterium thuringiense TaxID=1003091 RepID=A0ABQ4TQ30_9HYPH|nr:hypothetical protein EKPJFOCH_3920 [Methylobacterium thuringiense]